MGNTSSKPTAAPRDQDTVIPLSNLPADQASSPLLRLRAELRIAIYDYVLLEPHPVHLNTANPASAVTGPHTFDPLTCQGLVQQPGLVRTCRQVRNEALHIFYTGNDFMAALTDDQTCRSPASENVARKWLRAIGAKNRSMLRHILVHHLQWPRCLRARDIMRLSIPGVGLCLQQEKRQLSGENFFQVRVDDGTEQLMTHVHELVVGALVAILTGWLGGLLGVVICAVFWPKKLLLGVVVWCCYRVLQKYLRG